MFVLNKLHVIAQPGPVVVCHPDLLVFFLAVGFWLVYVCVFVYLFMQGVFYFRETSPQPPPPPSGMIDERPPEKG